MKKILIAAAMLGMLSTGAKAHEPTKYQDIAANINFGVYCISAVLGIYYTSKDPLLPDLSDPLFALTYDRMRKSHRDKENEYAKSCHLLLVANKFFTESMTPELVHHNFLMYEIWLAPNGR